MPLFVELLAFVSEPICIVLTLCFHDVWIINSCERPAGSAVPGNSSPECRCKDTTSAERFQIFAKIIFVFSFFNIRAFLFHFSLAGNCRIGKKLPGMPSARPSGTLIPDVPSPTRSLSERSGERNLGSEIKLGNYIEFGPKIMIRFAS